MIIPIWLPFIFSLAHHLCSFLTASVSKIFGDSQNLWIVNASSSPWSWECKVDCQLWLNCLQMSHILPPIPFCWMTRPVAIKLSGAARQKQNQLPFSTATLPRWQQVRAVRVPLGVGILHLVFFIPLYSHSWKLRYSHVLVRSRGQWQAYISDSVCNSVCPPFFTCTYLSIHLSWIRENICIEDIVRMVY